MNRAVCAVVGYWAVIGLAQLSETSFASVAFNALLLLCGYVSVAALLATAAFRIRPWWLGRCAGALLLTGFAALLYLIFLAAAFYPWRPDFEGEQDGLVCRGEVFGESADSARIEIDVFRPYLFGLIERRVSSKTLHDDGSMGDWTLSGCPASAVAPGAGSIR